MQTYYSWGIIIVVAGEIIATFEIACFRFKYPKRGKDDLVYEKYSADFDFDTGFCH